MIPPKLEEGDEVRVVAPSRSLPFISESAKEMANKRLGKKFELSFGENVDEIDEFNSSSVQSRVEDLHDAFSDDNVKAILSVIGGFNSNQLLDYLDYDLIRENPTILCGYSDITALANAIYAKTGMVTYSGPHYSTFGMRDGFDYIWEYFEKCLMQGGTFEVGPSEQWSNDDWYHNQDDREFIENEGPFVINEGKAEGTIVGANQSTFRLLHGTEYMPELEGSIVFLERDKSSGAKTDVWFDRTLQSLVHQPGFEGVQGICIGRFEKASEMTREKIEEIIKRKPELDDMPVVAGLDFGHTEPMFTFPIGGEAKLSVRDGIELEIIEH